MTNPIIRAVVVDDSAFVRKVVRQMLEQSPHIEVVGTARGGEDALQMVQDLNPDLVTCDLNMPGMGGVEFVRAQMARKPVPILILTASPQDAQHVLDALDAGAVDFIQKPTLLASDELFNIREKLIEMAKAAARAPRLGPEVLETESKAEPISYPTHPPEKVDVVVLGISTGGPQALRLLIPQIPADFPVPFVIVLHMPVGYTAPFAEKLKEISKIHVLEAFEDCAVERGQVLIAPAGRHLSLKKTSAGRIVCRLSMNPMGKPHRPSVDVLFQSAAETFQARVLGVVMTGMGDDGREGAAWIKSKGGTVITESESSCIIYGMPRSVVDAGLSDGEAPLHAMAAEIVKRL